MKRNKRIIISILVLVIVAAGIGTALFCVGNREKKSENKTQTEAKKSEKPKKEKVEETKEEPVAEIPQDQSTSVIFTGDVLLSNYVLQNYEKSGVQGILGETLLNELQQADITVINEEFPFGTTGTPAEDKQFTFRVNPSYVDIFKQMGVDAVTLANNHILDYGEEPLAETMKTLDEAEILYAGAGDSIGQAKELQVIEVNGKRYGMLAASRVIPVASWNVQNHAPGVFCTYDPTLLLEEIKAARSQCDYLAVYVHWGIERNANPEDYQKNMARQYIDAGADAVIGSHPHVLQGIEYYNGKPIFYSLGNFIFNQSIERTMAVKFEISAQGEVQIRILPAAAENARTAQEEGSEAQATYHYIESISNGIAIDDNGLLSNCE